MAASVKQETSGSRERGRECIASYILMILVTGNVEAICFYSAEGQSSVV